MNRRGKANTIYSDNAKTFKKVSEVLTILYSPRNKKKIRDSLHHEGIKWKFIPPRSPWVGGFYERLVKNVKVPLRRVLGKARLSVSELQTVLTDIEAQVNSRPLLSVSSDHKDPLPITPGHLTVGRNLQCIPDDDSITQKMGLDKRWQLSQKLSKLFWNPCYKEYVAGLNIKRKWFEEQGNAKVGGVVLITDDSKKKMEWPMGRIVEVHPGRDGLVRSVTLRTKSGLIRRSVQRLRLLEGVKI
ncbi:uncharacterized protein LOC141902097 [Tubulanus polymorphus]|uniref:uncharacterized protein LOC141902097 n=1 Tax=Tubulanus polymorphus TaxID=672921 RepID=UPI003DA46CB0